jgi:hypothetical protein
MLDFSAFIPETHWDISSGYVETLIQARREELFTGLMRLSSSPGENLVFTFLDGVQQRLYRFLEHGVDVVPRQGWFGEFDRPNLSAGFLKLPVEAVRFTRITCEAPVVRVEKSTFSPETLIDVARKWSTGHEPAVVRIQNDVINKYCLIAGHSTPVVEELSFGAGGARFSITDATFSQTLPKANYLVTRYVSDHEHEVWREYELRLAFGPLIRMLLTRFGELAGRALTERLCERLAAWIRAGGWNLSINSNGIVNHQYFETLKDAVSFYSDLVRYFQSEASPALGPHMMDGISRDVLIKLDPHRRELLTRYIYSRAGVSVTGVV